jgi:hypothetical protein
VVVEHPLQSVCDPAVSLLRRMLVDQRRAHAVVTELSRIRREAFDDLRRQGLSQTEVARLVGLSRGRIGQLAGSGPAPERLFLGDDDLTAIVAQKQEAGRPVIAAETLTAVNRLQALSSTLGLAVRVEAVPPPGSVDVNRDNVVIFGGPRVLPIVGELMAADPYLSFRQDDGGHWYLHDAEAGQDFRSPQDDGEHRDYGYLARLPRPDGQGKILIAAGIHPIGLQGVVALLETDMADLYAAVGTSRFSAVVESRYNPATLTVIKARAVLPPRLHP